MSKLGSLKLIASQLGHRLHGNWADVQSDYDQVASSYDDYYVPNMEPALNTLTAQLPREFGQGSTVVELAAGTGALTRSLLTRMPSGHLTAVDISQEMLNASREKNHNNADRLSLVRSDATDYLKSLDSGSVDALACAWGICYMPSKLLKRELHRVLKPGGEVYLIENTKDSLKELLGPFEKMIRERPSVLRSAIPFALPKDASRIAAQLCEASDLVLHKQDGEVRVKADSASATVDYVVKAGVASGLMNSIEPSQRDVLLQRMATAIEQRGIEHFPIVHRFGVVVFKVAAGRSNAPV